MKIKFKSKKILKLALTASALTTLSSCGMFTERKIPFMVAPTNLVYDPVTSTVTWDAVKNAESYDIAYDLRDRISKLEDNYKSFITTETSFVIPLDPETKDGDKIDIMVSGLKEGYQNSYARTQGIVAGKDIVDYTRVHNVLRDRFQIKLNQQANGYTFSKILQLEYDYTVGTIFCKILAKNEQGTLGLFAFTMDWEKDYGLYDISSAQGLLKNMSSPKYSWEYNYGGTVYESPAPERILQMGQGLTGSAIYSNYWAGARFTPRWEYITQANQNQYGWEFGLIGEVDVTRVIFNQKFEFALRYEYAMLIPNKPEIQTQQDVINYYKDNKSLLGLAEIERPSEELRGSLSKHVRYFEEHFYNDEQSQENESSESLTSTPILNANYTMANFVYPKNKNMKENALAQSKNDFFADKKTFEE